MININININKIKLQTNTSIYTQIYNDIFKRFFSDFYYNEDFQKRFRRVLNNCMIYNFDYIVKGDTIEYEISDYILDKISNEWYQLQIHLGLK
jgi:hypothetical protein